MRATMNYGAVSIVKPRRDKQRTADDSDGCCQLRLLLYLMIFLAGSISYALRVSLSQALVAMVNRTSHHTSYNASEDELCPRDVNTTSDDVIYGGQFHWDRNAQGAVLAAFYYGYALIQVNYITQLYDVNLETSKSNRNTNNYDIMCDFNNLCGLLEVFRLCI